MARHYQNLLRTPAVIAAQNAYYGPAVTAGPGHAPVASPTPQTAQTPIDQASRASSDPLTQDEIDFIQSRDSFYMATVSESGWPYVQHRGGQAGFLKVLDEHTLAFADYKGNRQLLSTGHVAQQDRTSLFLMDYPGRTRLKILAHARTVDVRTDPALREQVAAPTQQHLVERVFLLDVVSFDWNCPKYINPRYTTAEVQTAVAPLHTRIQQLENELAQLRRTQT